MWSVVKPMIRGFRAFQRVRETKFIEQDSGGFNRRDQDMLEDVVHEKQVGFRMRKELGMAMKTFVVPMFVGFLLAKQSFGGFGYKQIRRGREAFTRAREESKQRKR